MADLPNPPVLASNGDYELTNLDPGRQYNLALSGAFGGGTVTLYHWDGSAFVAAPQTPWADDGEATIVARTSTVRFSLTGATSPSIAVSFAPQFPAASGGGSVTPAAIVAAAENMTEEQKQSLLPDVIEVDYIETADQTGFTIPDNAFGHKGGIPYFGNTLIAPPPPKLVYAAYNGLANGVQGWKRSLATFPIPAGAMNDSSRFWMLEVDFTFDAITAIAPASGEIGLFLMHQAEFDSFSAGTPQTGDISLFLRPNTIGNKFVGYKGLWLLNGSGSLFSGGQASFLKFDALNSVSAGDVYVPALSNDYGVSYGSGSSSPGVAENMHLCLGPTSGAVNRSFPGGVLHGKFNFYEVEVSS